MAEPGPQADLHVASFMDGTSPGVLSAVSKAPASTVGGITVVLPTAVCPVLLRVQGTFGSGLGRHLPDKSWWGRMGKCS